MVSVIPHFDRRTGHLPLGVHRASWREIEERFATNRHRRTLLRGLYRALTNLAHAGCRSVLLDGSFVTSKAFPGDYDGAWDTEEVDVNRLDPILMDLSNLRLAMKAKYAGELFPASSEARRGISFSEFFQADRNGERKGIVQIDLLELP